MDFRERSRCRGGPSALTSRDDHGTLTERRVRDNGTSSSNSTADGDREGDSASLEDELDGFLRAPLVTVHRSRTTAPPPSQPRGGVASACRGAATGPVTSAPRKSSHRHGDQYRQGGAHVVNGVSAAEDYGLGAWLPARTAASTRSAPTDTTTTISSDDTSSASSSVVTDGDDCHGDAAVGVRKVARASGPIAEGVVQQPSQHAVRAVPAAVDADGDDGTSASDLSVNSDGRVSTETFEADDNLPGDKDESDNDGRAEVDLVPPPYVPLSALQSVHELHELQRSASAAGPAMVPPALMESMDGELLDIIRAYYERRQRLVSGTPEVGEEEASRAARVGTTSTAGKTRSAPLSLPVSAPPPVTTSDNVSRAAHSPRPVGSCETGLVHATERAANAIASTVPAASTISMLPPRSPPETFTGQAPGGVGQSFSVPQDYCATGSPGAQLTHAQGRLHSSEPVRHHRQPSLSSQLYGDPDAHASAADVAWRGGATGASFPPRRLPEFGGGGGGASGDVGGGGGALGGAGHVPSGVPPRAQTTGDFSRLPSFSATSFVRAYVSDVNLSVEPAVVVTLLAAALNIVVVLFLQHHVLDTRDHLGLFLIGSYLIFSSYYMVYYFLERFSSSFRRIGSQDKKFYIIGNLLKAGILVSITPFAVYHLTRIIVFDRWESNILRNLGCIYAIPDFISMIIVKRMRWSTWIHHLCVVVFNYFSILNDYQQENVCRCVVVYAAFSSFAYCVNVLLASRFLGVSVSVARVLSFVALVVYVLCCAINWVWQVYYLRRLILGGHDHWTVYVYMCLIALVMWDDVVLNKWLLHHARNTAFAAAQQLKPPPSVSPLSSMMSTGGGRLGGASIPSHATTTATAMEAVDAAGGRHPVARSQAGGSVAMTSASPSAGGVVNVVHRREGVMPGLWSPP